MLPHHGKKPKESSLENGAQLEENKTRGISYCLAESTLFYRKALKTARSDYFSSLLEENKHSPRYLFNTVAKFTKNKASTGVEISQQHSSVDFMNYFTSKIDTIKRCKSRAAKIIKTRITLVTIFSLHCHLASASGAWRQKLRDWGGASSLRPSGS